MKIDNIIIGTRGSQLALWQANMVKSTIESKFNNISVTIKKIKTTGDKILDVPLAKVGGKGLFVKEIEDALINGEIDIAVHSMKDVPAIIPDGLHIGAIMERENPMDVLISKNHKKLSELPSQSKIGTSSLRRQSQLFHVRKDLIIIPLRGNLDTRLKKLEQGVYDAILLAYAGLKRIGMIHLKTEVLDFIPAVGQGAVGIELRKNEIDLNNIINDLNHTNTYICVKSERAFLSVLEGGCQVPIACHGIIQDGKIKMEGMVSSTDGTEIISDSIEGKPEEGEEIGKKLAEILISRGADKILSEVYGR